MQTQFILMRYIAGDHALFINRQRSVAISSWW